MNNVSFYRKYRPTNFDDVVGQKKIVTVLKNSVLKDLVRHAYIFSGPRGTGKTSLAKLFARKINCTCTDNSCPLCSDFSKEFSDIWEIDAASNNSVNNIRDLIEDAMYLPLELSKKVYIIDEVHMLSNSAFNALLKTLEEPPSHIVFILATTELNKVLTTVLSRCVKLEFDLISQPEITARLKHVCEKESISYEIKALEIISSLADGGLRDSLSLLETVYSNHFDITLDNTVSALNIAKQDTTQKLFDAMVVKDIDQIKTVIDKIVIQGINYIKFINQFISYLKSILKEFTIENKRVISTWLVSLVELFDKLPYTKNQGLLFETKIIYISLCSGDIIIDDNKEINNNPFHEQIKEVVDDNKEINNNPFHEQIKEVVDDTPLEVEETLFDMLEIKKEPVKVTKTSLDSKIVLFDILTDAAKKGKKEKVKLISSYITLKSSAENDKLFSVAKFFELSNVEAASSFGCVISIADDMYQLYAKRIDDIKKYMCNQIKDLEQVFIYSKTLWLEKRQEFLNKPNTENKSDLDLAIKIFGKEHVKKI